MPPRPPHSLCHSRPPAYVPACSPPTPAPRVRVQVLVVWLGPLGARVEAERQLAGGAAAHGEAPLAPPHLTNKGLMAFRSQVRDLGWLVAVVVMVVRGWGG